MSAIRSICVYCGSSPGHDSIHLEAARSLGRSMAEAGLRLVYGGGTRGVMGAVADAVQEAGGAVTGIIPRFLIDMEANGEELKRLDELHVTEDMHQRKHMMFRHSDAFVALPGGIGTLEELVEIMTWSQLGRHAKPIAIANIGGFWDPLLKLVDHMRDAGFIHRAQHLRPLVVDQAQDIVPAILAAPTDGPHEEASGFIERM
ncbi:TIGR00730 family Rossman fold protein [Consotaella aegiceratis]|uniref:LOG family protein n=1 Tax=Consotaella aegiceratis TaxID=3097961 RepID=UPI002F40B56B